MAKKKNIDSFNGFTFGVSEGEQKASVQTGATAETEEKTIKEKVQTTLQGGTAPKKRGRPKVNREIKKRISFTILPSLYNQASEIAYNEGKSVSELVSEFLQKYVDKHK